MAFSLTGLIILEFRAIFPAKMERPLRVRSVSECIRSIRFEKGN